MRSRPPNGKADVSIFATGSEVEIAVDGAEAARRQRHRGPRRLGALLRIAGRSAGASTPRGHRRRQGQDRRRGGRAQGWDAIIGSDGVFVGMTGFGASAPYKELYKHFGITAEAVAERSLRKKLGKA